MGTAYNTNVVTDGLRGCWDAGNRKSYPTTGTVLTDLAGGVNGTLTNEDDDALNFNSFKGGYLEFDGTDGRVDCGDNLIVGWSEISICVWALVENSGDSYQKLVTRGHGAVCDFAIGRTTVNWLYCYINGPYLATPVDTMNDYYGKWTHYAVRWVTGADNWRLYINGEVKAIGTRYDSTLSSTGKYNLSFADRPTGGRALDGAMGPVYIYDRALSDAEVKQNYEATKSRFAPRITKSDMVGNWDAGDPQCFDGNMVNYYTASTYNLKDLSSGNIGQFQNMVPLENFSLDNGGYWEFDGTDDWFSAGIGSSPNDMYNVYSNANGFTAAMWVNRNGDGDDEVFFWKEHVYQFRYDSNQRLNLASGDGSNWGNSDTDLVSSASLLSDNTWHFVVGLANKSNDAREIWLDGVRVANDTGSGMLWGTDGEWMSVGAMPAVSTYRCLEGKIAMATLYGRALSAGEIKDFYNKTKARFGH